MSAKSSSFDFTWLWNHLDPELAGFDIRCDRSTTSLYLMDGSRFSHHHKSLMIMLVYHSLAQHISWFLFSFVGSRTWQGKVLAMTKSKSGYCIILCAACRRVEYLSPTMNDSIIRHPYLFPKPLICLSYWDNLLFAAVNHIDQPLKGFSSSLAVNADIEDMAAKGTCSNKKIGGQGISRP